MGIGLINQLYSSPKHVNIGGGPNFSAFRWINLEAVSSRVNSQPFILSPDCQFPLPSNSVWTVYNSHNLEHLDSDTAHRVIAEAHRVLKNKGHLILKIPDYDKIIELWKKEDHKFFRDEWSIDSIVWSWKNRGIPDTLDYRVAVIFCGFWNDEYGDHFSNKISRNSNAYHGPPVVSQDFLQNLKKGKQPGEIAKILRNIVIQNEPSYHFNHQTAWGKHELINMVTAHGFKVVSTDTNEIIKTFSYIPGIKDLQKISLYLAAEKSTDSQ
jgi:SAM-dependent methyltransferase